MMDDGTISGPDHRRPHRSTVPCVGLDHDSGDERRPPGRLGLGHRFGPRRAHARPRSRDGSNSGLPWAGKWNNPLGGRTENGANRRTDRNDGRCRIARRRRSSAPPASEPHPWLVLGSWLGTIGILLAAVGCGCESEPVAPLELDSPDLHPELASSSTFGPIEAQTPCRPCHPAAGDPEPTGLRLGTPAPSWHVLDGHGVDWDDCGDCHAAGRFIPARFDHQQAPRPVRFALTGWHRRPPNDDWAQPLDDTKGAPMRCDRCHGKALSRPNPDATTDEVEEIQGRCYGCHNSQRPVSHGFLSPRCADCHNPAGFKGARFAHTAEQTRRDGSTTGFPLAPVHQSLRCRACHLPDSEGARQPIDPACACCHTHRALSATVAHWFPLRWRPSQPGERASDRTVCGPDSGLDGRSHKDCGDCHGTVSFEAITYPHTRWALTGRHEEPRFVGERAVAKCDRCHLGRTEGPLPTACVGCHRRPDGDPPGRATSWPPSHQFGWPTFDGCVPCHSTDVDWNQPRFDHQDPATGNSSLATHQEADLPAPLVCNDCHLSRNDGERTSTVGCGGEERGSCHAREHAIARVLEAHPPMPDQNCATPECHPIDGSDGWTRPPTEAQPP